uniref:Uncharacterized protein n=1 Tax=Anopheles minimus TaxID=112268 RepID=A0A182WJ19_9DIPT
MQEPNANFLQLMRPREMACLRRERVDDGVTEHSIGRGWHPSNASPNEVEEMNFQDFFYAPQKKGLVIMQREECRFHPSEGSLM